MTTFDTALAQDFVRLTKQQEGLEAQLDAVKRERDAVHARLLREFERSGLQRLTVDGRTVYLRREVKAFKAKGVKTEDLLDGLRAAGLTDYVKESYSAQSLTGLAKTWDREEHGEEAEQMPPELEGLLTVQEKFDVRAVKA